MSVYDANNVRRRRIVFMPSRGVGSLRWIINFGLQFYEGLCVCKSNVRLRADARRLALINRRFWKTRLFGGLL